MAEAADRLHAIDALWLEMEGDGPPIAIGTVAVCAGPVPADDELHTMLADRIERMPRLHQGLSDQGSGLRRPVWVEARGWEPADHVHHLDAAPSGAHPESSPFVANALARVPLETGFNKKNSVSRAWRTTRQTDRNHSC